MPNKVKAKRQQSINTTDHKGVPVSQSTSQEVHYEGMFPIASETDKFEKIHPGFMAKTFEMAQQLQNHNIDMQKQLVASQVRTVELEEKKLTLQEKQGTQVLIKDIIANILNNVTTLLVVGLLGYIGYECLAKFKSPEVAGIIFGGGIATVLAKIWRNNKK